MYRYTHVQTRTNTRTATNTCIETHMHRHAHVQTRTCTDTHMYRHAHLQTHTNTCTVSFYSYHRQRQACIDMHNAQAKGRLYIWGGTERCDPLPALSPEIHCCRYIFIYIYAHTYIPTYIHARKLVLWSIKRVLCHKTRSTLSILRFISFLNLNWDAGHLIESLTDLLSFDSTNCGRHVC